MGELGAAYVSIYPKVEADSLGSSLKDSLGSVGDVGGDLGSKITGGIGAKLKAMPWASYALAGAAAFAAAFKMGFDAYSQVEEGANNVILATGATGEAAEQLKGVYKDVASSVVGDFGDIGAAVGELNTRLGLNGDELEAASEAAMKYAKVNGVDAKSAIQDVTRMMNNAGISSGDYAETLDKLTVAAQQSGIDVSSLAQNVTANAASFKELGFSTDESIALLANFEKVGANSSQVLAGMKKGVAEWAKEGLSAKDGFAQFVQGVQDGTVTSADAIDLFGARAGMTMYDAASKGQLDFEAMYAAITEGSAGMTDQMYNDTLTATEKMDLAWKNVTLAGAELFAPAVEAFSGFLTNTVVPFAQKLRDYVGKAREAIETSRIGEVFQGIADTVAPAVEFVQNEVKNAFEDVRSVTDEVMGAVNDVVQDVWPDISATVQAAVDIVKQVVPPAWNLVKTVVSTVMGNVRGVVQAVWPVISGIVKGAVDHIKNVIGGISTIISKVKSTFNSVKSAIEDPINKARDTVKNVVDKIKGIFPLNIGKIFSNLQLPHISVSGGSPPFGIGGKGSLPSFSVNWYAKGGFVDDATLIGAGEAGPEMILPKKGELMDAFSSAVASKVGSADERPNVYVGDIQVTPESELYGLLMQVGETMLEDRRRAGRKAVYA